MSVCVLQVYTLMLKELNVHTDWLYVKIRRFTAYRFKLQPFSLISGSFTVQSLIAHARTLTMCTCDNNPACTQHPLSNNKGLHFIEWG